MRAVLDDTSTEHFLANLNILLVDGNAYMRRVTRNMLMNIGARHVTEAADGISALDHVRSHNPDVMLLDWDLPHVNGIEVMRIIRSPGLFPRANLPTIMLTSSASPELVREAMRAGVHEFLVKPTSAKALADRLTAIVMNPRPMVQIGEHYIPKPREVVDDREVSRWMKAKLAAG